MPIINRPDFGIKIISTPSLPSDIFIKSWEEREAFDRIVREIKHICPECGKQLEFMERAYVCKECGYGLVDMIKKKDRLLSMYAREYMEEFFKVEDLG